MNPVRDLEIIHNELRLKVREPLISCYPRCFIVAAGSGGRVDDHRLLCIFLTNQVYSKLSVKTSKEKVIMRSGDKDAKAELVQMPNFQPFMLLTAEKKKTQATLKKVQEVLEAHKDVRFAEWGPAEVSFRRM